MCVKLPWFRRTPIGRPSSCELISLWELMGKECHWLSIAFGRNMNEAAAYFSGDWYHKDLLIFHILCCSTESSTPINRAEELHHFLRPGLQHTHTHTLFFFGWTLMRLKCLKPVANMLHATLIQLWFFFLCYMQDKLSHENKQRLKQARQTVQQQGWKKSKV